MRVIPGILMLLAVSGASASASASKFDFNSALSSVLKTVLDTRQYDAKSENEREFERYEDEAQAKHERYEAEHEAFLNTCWSYSDCENQPEKRRVINRALENQPYICELDDSYGSDRQEEHGIVEGFTAYASDQWIRAEKDCFQRVRVVEQQKYQERQRAAKIEAERIAKIPKKPEAKIGMTRDQVKKSRWGNPTFTDITTNSKGTYEKWRYYNGTLYFTNGKLTSIEQNKSVWLPE